MVFALPGPAARAADIRPTLTDAQAQFEQARYEQALKLYEQANETEPGHPAIEYNIALCHLQLGNADKAIQAFETLASRADVNQSLRRDAFYNVGLIRARGAHGQLKELFAPATQPSDRKPAPDDPANMPMLQAVADELLRAIAGFRKSVEVEASDDAQHNIRAARTMRRDVLGLLRKAAEAKEKDDILKDPRGYLETLIFQQGQQASLARLLILSAPKEPAVLREARRAGIRAQRKIMENTGTFADQLSQFREATEKTEAAPASAPASAPSSQPAEGTPRERLYKAVARQINTAIESQREACAFLLDGEIDSARQKQAAACDQMYAALFMFPMEPGQTLVKAAVEQKTLRQLVDSIKTQEDWLRDPLVAEAAIPKETPWDPDKAPLRMHQARVGAVLALLRRQCEHVATTSQPAGQATARQQPPEPMLDPELNRKLADALKETDTLVGKALDGIAARDRKPTLTAQDDLLKMIEAAIDLLPKTLEQRIMELIARQGRLNADVQAEAGEAPNNAAAMALDDIRKWTTRLKSRLLGNVPAKLAEQMAARQKTIRTDTVAVNDEVKQKVPAGAGPQLTASPPASQPAEVKPYIEASKHLVEAVGQMDAGLKGFEQAVVEDSLRPMQPGAPVQVAQGKALEELVKALAALKPPASQPSKDQDQQKQQDQQAQPQQQEQDRQRELDRMDKQREQAERELYQRRPRTVIKDW